MQRRSTHHVAPPRARRPSAPSAGTRRAEDLAARTINKLRREEGRATNDSRRSTGDPNTPLEHRTYRQLYNRARQLRIAGRSTMGKLSLISAIRERNS